MKTLYEASFDIVIYAMAETDGEAKEVALAGLREETHNLTAWDVSVFREPTGLFEVWKNAYPYGDDDENRTVGQIFEHIQERKKKEAEYQEYLKQQGKLFNEPKTLPRAAFKGPG